MIAKKYTPRSLQSRALLLWAALLLAALAPAAGVAVRVARAQSDGQDSFQSLREELNREARKENIQRRLTFALLEPYLPAGTEMTSGYRNADDQLSLIKRMAVSKGIIPSSYNMSLNDPNTWSGVLDSLRGKGVIIAAPYTTPHGRDAAVFDMSGPDLAGIARGVKVAESKGLIKIAQIIHEHVNHCIHVEIQWVNTRAFTGLAETRPWRIELEASPAPSNTNGGGGAAVTPTPSPEGMSAEKRRLLEEFYSLHDSAEGNPLKQIEYDKQIIRELNPLDDRERINNLYVEIDRHQQKADEARRETEQNNAAAGKQKLIDSRVAAEMSGDDEAALRYAEELAKEFPDAPEAKVADRLRTRLRLSQARAAFDDADCNKCSAVEGQGCARAWELIDKAWQAQRDDPQAQRLNEEMETVRGNCGAYRRARLGLLVLLVLGLGVGLYFWLRPGKYVLEGVLGPCKGQVFALDKLRVRIGAMPHVEEEEGNVDIHISDPERKISRVHCLLTQSGRYWYLKDESANGTKVNDRAVQKDSHQRLAGGDEISLADEAVLVFRRR